MECGSPKTLVDSDNSHVVDNEILPSHLLMPVYLDAREETLARKLWYIAEKSKVRHHQNS